MADPKMDPPAATAVTVKSEPPGDAARPQSRDTTTEMPMRAASASVGGGKKRKARRQAVTEDEDIAMLRAAAKIQPHRAPWGLGRKRWQSVADAVVEEVGGHNEVSAMLCQRRYDMLVDRFIVHRQLAKNWPRNPEMRRLLEAAVEDRKLRDESVDKAASKRMAKVMTRQPQLTMESLRAALAAATGTATPEESIEVKVERIEKKESEDAGEPREAPPLEKAVATLERIAPILPIMPADKPVASSVGTGVAPAEKKTNDDALPPQEDPLLASAPSSRSPTKRRAFVESTLVAVLDRLASLESAWLENARQERALKKEQLELERETLKMSRSADKITVESSPREETKKTASPRDEKETVKLAKFAKGDATNATGSVEDVSMAVQDSAKPAETVKPTTSAESTGDDGVSPEHVGENAAVAADGDVPNAQVSKTSGDEDISTARYQPIVTSAESGEPGSEDVMGADGTTVVTGSATSSGVSHEPTETSPPAIGQETEAPGSDREPQKAGLEPSTTSAVSVDDFARLKHEFGTLKSSLQVSQTEQAQLKQQVTELKHSLDETRREKDTLQSQVSSLQALLRDAASLAGTLKLLRDAHREHEQRFQDHVSAVDARLNTLRAEIRECYRHQLATSKSPDEVLTAIQKEQIRMRTDHRVRLAELQQKTTQAAQLQASLATQQVALVRLEAAQSRESATTEKAIAQLREEIDRERRERHDEYGALLQSIEQVLAGQTPLI